MSLFLPSNLSPNFEEVFTTNLENENVIDFSFQVNTNGSQIRSYKIEILNENFDLRIFPPFKEGKKYLLKHYGTLYESVLPKEKIIQILLED